eukprot:SAG11_NODE_21405_length_425_cov_2.055215_1_plen_22_part_10
MVHACDFKIGDVVTFTTNPSQT